jgi:acid phosphatase type 7
MRPRVLVVVLAALVVAAGLGVLVAASFMGDEELAGAGDPVLLAAGDIAECDRAGDEATAEILDEYPAATIATLGDNAYPEGTLQQFVECYHPSWGRHKERTRPAVGNHDHSTKDAAGYFEYFGEAGGEFDRYYYSYDLGAWHVVVLNSDCWRVDGCEPDDPQGQWLQEDLAASPGQCTLAYWHRPPFSSGRYGEPKDVERVRPLWELIYDMGVDVLLAGHEHSYERFAPMNDAGERDDERGVRLFVVGTGGGNLRNFEYDPLPTTEARNAETWGVLKLTLKPAGYDWEFLPVDGRTFTDSGSDSCH